MRIVRVLERIRAGKDRAWVRGELIATGVPEADADTWCDRWEGEARRIGLHADTDDFWTIGSVWIKERQRRR